jgi:pimeloyl-ACP methyl ester carboxylesterase
MEATGTGHAVIVSLSLGAQRALLLAAGHPDRVAGAVFIAPFLPLAATPVDGPPDPWDVELTTDEGWAKWNRHYWLRDHRGFLEFFFSQMFTEPHSTKPAEDCVGWGLDTTAETLVAAESGDELDEQTTRELCRRIRCPVLVIQGTDDAITSKDCGIARAATLSAGPRKAWGASSRRITTRSVTAMFTPSSIFRTRPLPRPPARL